MQGAPMRAWVCVCDCKLCEMPAFPLLLRSCCWSQPVDFIANKLPRNSSTEPQRLAPKGRSKEISGGLQSYILSMVPPLSEVPAERIGERTPKIAKGKRQKSKTVQQSNGWILVRKDDTL